MPTYEFELPDVGEGLTEAEVVEWKVGPGDPVELNQTIVEIETAKSLVELPSPYAGTVGELRAEVGETVPVGEVLLTIRAAGGDDAMLPPDERQEAAPASEDGESAGADQSAEPPRAGAAAGEDEFASARADAASTITPRTPDDRDEDGASGSVLVGYGVASAPASRRRGRGRGAALPGGMGGAAQGLGADATKRAATERAADDGAAGGPSAARARRQVARSDSVPASLAAPIIAKPPIRKLARDLGVDLAAVEPTGLAGETTRDDVIRHAHQASVFRNLETPAPGPEDAREEVHPVKGVRKAIANAMVTSMFTAPHVTLFVDVDASRTMQFVSRLKASPDFAGVKVSPLLIVAKAVMWAIRRNPIVNAAWTDEAYTIKRYVNLGFAAATPRGLLVPNIKDADGLSLRELAQAIEQLTLRARDGKTTPEEQQGGTFTITNIGVFGMDSGTPILNPGEVGILALGTIKPKPWVVEDEVRVRQVTTLTASFDHRLVDGDVASRFLADVATIVEEPALLLD